MTPEEIVRGLAAMSPDQLRGLAHSDLYRARALVGRGEAQNKLAAYEHEAFAREATRDNPLMALPIAVATPLYTGAKALGLTDSRSDPSLAQVGQGLRGVGDGLWAAFQDGIRSIEARTAGTGKQTPATALLESLREHLREPSKASRSRQ